MDERDHDAIPEIALVGDLTDNEGDLSERLLGIRPGGKCTLYIDSPGGSPYCAISLLTIIKLRNIQATGIVTGECSSAALWPLAACVRRIVTPYSVMLFHPMKWQSEEHVGLAEAAEWARHFGQLEKEMDGLLADLFGIPRETMDSWIVPGRYITGREFVAAGLGELVELKTLDLHQRNGSPANRRRPQESNRPVANRPTAKRPKTKRRQRE